MNELNVKILEPITDKEMEMAYMLTAYERYGSVGREEFIELFIDEYLEVTERLIQYYNEYEVEVMNGEYYYDDLDEMLYGMTPNQAFLRTYYGKCNPLDDYFYFNGYGNIDSMTDTELVEQMKGDKKFLEWYIDNYMNLNEDSIKRVVRKCNELIKEGY